LAEEEMTGKRKEEKEEINQVTDLVQAMETQSQNSVQRKKLAIGRGSQDHGSKKFHDKRKL